MKEHLASFDADYIRIVIELLLIYFLRAFKNEVHGLRQELHGLRETVEKLTPRVDRLEGKKAS